MNTPDSHKEDLLRRSQPIFDALWNDFPSPEESCRVLIHALLKQLMLGPGEFTPSESLNLISTELNRQLALFQTGEDSKITASLFP